MMGTLWVMVIPIDHHIGLPVTSLTKLFGLRVTNVLTGHIIENL